MSDQLPGQENRVWLNDRGLIEIRVVGRQTAGTVRAMGDLVVDLAGQQRAKGQRVLIIDDLSAMGLKQPTAVPKEVAAQVRRIDFDRVAMVGSSNRLLKHGT